MGRETRYFGAPRRGREGVRFPASVIVGAVAAAALAVTFWSIKQQSLEVAQATAETQAQDIVGPPCPRVSRGALAEPLRPVRVFDFDGVDFGRSFGEADCSAIAKKSLLGNGYQLVCQFSSPAVLAVKSDKGLFYFEPGIGREATVFVLDGSARCVLASPYFAQWKQAVTETDAEGKPTFAADDQNGPKRR